SRSGFKNEVIVESLSLAAVILVVRRYFFKIYRAAPVIKTRSPVENG
ncbi:hypothetical protein X975_01216, partial [Stegodyphus mimosarum]